MSEKIVTYENLARFKQNLDSHGYGESKLVLDAQNFDPETGLPTQASLRDIIENKYQIVEIINAPGISNEMFYLDTYNTYNNKVLARYTCKTSISENEIDFVGFEITKLNGQSEYTVKMSLPDFQTIEGNPNIPAGTIPYTLGSLKVGANYYTIGGSNLMEIDADVTPGDPIIIKFRNQDDLDLLKAGTLGQFILNGYVDGQYGGSYGLNVSSKVGTRVKYSSVEVDASSINITTLEIDENDTLASGSMMYGLTK